MDGVTHCLTIGRRPALLRQTLQSLPAALRALPTLAVNDFGDAESDAVFRALVPGGRIVGPGRHVGHHAAIDAMYAEVTTPLVWHGEDDWRYDGSDFLPRAARVLAAQPMASSVCLRDVTDFPPHTVPDPARLPRGDGFVRLDGLDAQWFGWTFNPHLALLTQWRRLGGFARFAKERHVSRALRAEGRFVAFLDPGACRHIGEADSTTVRAPKRLQGLRDWWRGR